MNLENYIKKSKTKKLQEEDKKFMASSQAQDHAEILLKQKAQNFKSKEEFVAHARERGFLKTDMDRKIVEHVAKKEGLKERYGGRLPANRKLSPIVQKMIAERRKRNGR